ncbi:aspartate dehydrogenase domain-containing protein [Streptomyces sp. NBC_01716]|uniref:aspartate dehydrogenase domain-containing protein n=1 Tax=Streptomyces sp. NBC_01716 TaxID=2975917 RepID=UPI002E3240EB|nr:aspartate dehydrogenase domain-containing protein [Streptomyces sp. NBC_01716]
MTWRIAVAGKGTIGARVAAELSAGRVAGCELVAVLDSSSGATVIGRALRAADLLVEASTAEAARALLPRALDAGRRVVLCSCGVLADRCVEFDLRRRGTVLGSGVMVPAGAIGGLDILGAAYRAVGRAVDRVSVRHTTTKGPAALGMIVTPTRPDVVFRGSAREAALAHPRTSNSSVALALATAGLDAVEVVVVADPDATRTRHRIELSSPVGRYDFAIENAVSPGSGGRTSEITAWSVIDTLEKLARCQTPAGPRDLPPSGPGRRSPGRGLAPPS